MYQNQYRTDKLTTITGKPDRRYTKKFLTAINFDRKNETQEPHTSEFEDSQKILN